MEDKDKGLRNLLHYLKNDYLKKNNPDEYIKRDEYCKEHIYDLVKENVEYFTKHNNAVCTNASIFYQVPISCLYRMKPSELCELSRRFYKSATGLFGLQNDGCTDIILTDYNSNAYKILCMSPIGYSINDYEFFIYNLTGIGCLLKFCIPLNIDKFSEDQLKEIKRLPEIVEEIKQEEIKSKQRYQELKTYEGTYLKRKYIQGGYAHKVIEVEVMNDIPTEINKDKIAKYADDWNYCFGGSISLKEITDNSKIYIVRIHTD